MQALSKVLACEKAIVLGGLYDTIEKLKWKLLSANSNTGIIVVAERSAGMPFLIRVCSQGTRKVEVTVELASGVFSDRDSPEDAAAVLLETLTRIIGDALSKNRLDSG
jgi:hypothetical protein